MQCVLTWLHVASYMAPDTILRWRNFIAAAQQSDMETGSFNREMLGEIMPTENKESAAEAQIRELIEARVKAVHAKDASVLASTQAKDIVMFDALNPLQYVGAEGAGKRTKEWLGWYDGPISYDIRDLSIVAGDDVAYCHYLYRINGTMTNGTQVDMWLRATVCFHKMDGGKWMIIHEHTSVPFDAESGKASVDLKP